MYGLFSHSIVEEASKKLESKPSNPITWSYVFLRQKKKEKS